MITIETLIENAARQLADYQAIRWALAKLKPGQRWPEIRTTWMKGGSGHLPTSLTYDNCLLKANNLVDKFFTEVSHVDQTKLATYASHFRQIFATEDFYAQQAYLVWFHGKDLFKQVFKELQLYLHSQKIMSDFPKDKYLWWAAANFEASRHPDLQALLSQLAI